MDFSGKTALVTGGASGIGKVTAEAFAQAGANLVISDVNGAAGEALAAQLQGSDLSAIFVKADVADSRQVDALIARCVAEFGSLDVAFNNAGIEGGTTRLADTSEKTFDQVIAVNLKGVFLCMRAEIQQMIQQGGGVIINIASAAGLVGAHSMATYAASKHAVIGLTRSAALEYVRKGVRVNAVCPAVIRTPLVERGFEAFPQLGEATIRNNPSRRIGEPEEVAQAVLWLASDAASYINGVALPIDGGFTAQ